MAVVQDGARPAPAPEARAVGFRRLLGGRTPRLALLLPARLAAPGRRASTRGRQYLRPHRARPRLQVPGDGGVRAARRARRRRGNDPRARGSRLRREGRVLGGCRGEPGAGGAGRRGSGAAWHVDPSLPAVLPQRPSGRRVHVDGRPGSG